MARTVYVDTVNGSPSPSDPTNPADAYNSASSAEAGEQTDLSSIGVLSIVCTGSVADSEVTVSGSTGVDSSHYMQFVAAAGDEALKTGWDEARYRLISASESQTVTLIDDSTKLLGLQINNTARRTVKVNGGNCVVGNCAITADNTYSLGGCFEIVGAGNTFVVNTFVYSIGVDGISNSGILVDNGIAFIFNSIVYKKGFGTGVQVESGGTLVATNVAVFNADDDFDILGTAFIGYCASDDGDGTNSLSPSGGDWDNEFVDPANGDFTLIPGGNLRHAGANDPGSGFYSDDIEGDPYHVGVDGSAFSVGVDEIVASAIMNQLQGNNLGADLYNGAIQ